MDKKEYMKLWREKNKEKIKEYNSKYQKDYREKNKEKIREKRKEYCEVHREELKEKSRKYAQEHKEEACERARKYYSENKEEVLKKNKEYRKREDVRKRINENSKRNYYRSIEMIDTSMYKLPEGAEIIDEKHVKYDGISYVVHKRGYLRSCYDTLHCYLMKKQGKYFEGCEVHHIDGNVLNNSLDNLICLTEKQHDKAHVLMRKNREEYYNWIKEIK